MIKSLRYIAAIRELIAAAHSCIEAFDITARSTLIQQGAFGFGAKAQPILEQRLAIVAALKAFYQDVSDTLNQHEAAALSWQLTANK